MKFRIIFLKFRKLTSPFLCKTLLEALSKLWNHSKVPKIFVFWQLMVVKKFNSNKHGNFYVDFISCQKAKLLTTLVHILIFSPCNFHSLILFNGGLAIGIRVNWFIRWSLLQTHQCLYKTNANIMQMLRIYMKSLLRKKNCYLLCNINFLI